MRGTGLWRCLRALSRRDRYTFPSHGCLWSCDIGRSLRSSSFFPPLSLSVGSLFSARFTSIEKVINRGWSRASVVFTWRAQLDKRAPSSWIFSNDLLLSALLEIIFRKTREGTTRDRSRSAILSLSLSLSSSKPLVVARAYSSPLEIYVKYFLFDRASGITSLPVRSNEIHFAK